MSSASPRSNSKVPPAVWTGLVALMAAASGWLVSQTQREPQSAPRSMSEPSHAEPIGEPSRDLDGDALTRWVRERANTEIKELRDRVTQLEAHVCAIKRDVRETRGEVVQIEGAKRKPPPRDEYNTRTAEWLVCPAPNGGPLQTLPSLDEAANGALGR